MDPCDSLAASSVDDELRFGLVVKDPAAARSAALLERIIVPSLIVPFLIVPFLIAPFLIPFLGLGRVWTVSQNVSRSVMSETFQCLIGGLSRFKAGRKPSLLNVGEKPLPIQPGGSRFKREVIPNRSRTTVPQAINQTLKELFASSVCLHAHAELYSFFRFNFCTTHAELLEVL